MNTVGVVHGRFQPFHNGHLKDLVLPAFSMFDHVVIGICNPTPQLTIYNKANPHRSKAENNPYTYWERSQMIIGSLLEAGIDRERFDVVPFPINIPDQISYFIPKDATHFLTIFDQWGNEKAETLKKLGYAVQTKIIDEDKKTISGTQIRNLIISKSIDWKPLVSNSTAGLITSSIGPLQV